MKNVVVVGYPKSGNTWLKRVVCDLVDGTPAAFLGSADQLSATNGDKPRCFKSHLELHELNANGKVEPPDNYIIYVIRDPRDVVMSGSNYFRFHRLKWLPRLFKPFWKGQQVYRALLYPRLSPESYRINQMFEATLYGSQKVSRYCRASWKAHYQPYADAGCFFVRYEDMLTHPEREYRRILEYVGIEKSEEEVRAIAEKHSFKKSKERFIKQGQEWNANFLRSGKRGQWREKLSQEQQDKFSNLLSEDLKRFSYAE